MSDPQFRQRLRAIFSEEAREHLGQVDAGLVALEQASGAQRAAPVQRILKALHTLKGAARTVDELELERLCHGLEGALAALRDAPAAASAEQFDRLHQAAGAARQVVEAPTLRSRKRASLLAGQLDVSGRQPGEAPEPVLPEDLQDEGSRPTPPAAAGAAERIRVDSRSIDAIRAHAEALLPVELKLRHHVAELRALASAADGSGAIELACARLASRLQRVEEELHAVRGRLHAATLETALVPSAAALDELPALVRNLARRHRKQVRLDTSGAAVAIDRRVLGVVREALIHLVTNAVDHAIETPELRSARGKDATGRISIAVAQRDARTVALRVSDDGAGIDTDAVAQAAMQRLGLEPEAVAQMSRQQRLQLALGAGVSTRAEVTQVSGRGMGLAIVADKVAAAGGQLLVETEPGIGTEFELLLPVGVASMRALVVEAGGARFALPLAGLDSVCRVAQAEVRTVAGSETVLAGGRVLPLVRLGVLFGLAPAAADGEGVVVVARSGAQAFAMLADAVVAEQDVLPKRLGPLLRRVRYFSGAAQLGDGALAPVVALEDIASHGMAGARAVGVPEQAAPATRVLVVEDSVTSRLLLKHILEGAGCSVDTATDGLDALSRLRGARYDAVVSDIEMPNMDGLALTASIRATAATAELPVILVTSLQTPEQRAAGLRAGADAYFTKGAFDQDRLLATVRRVAGMEVQ